MYRGKGELLKFVLRYYNCYMVMLTLILFLSRSTQINYKACFNNHEKEAVTLRPSTDKTHLEPIYFFRFV